jgi:hypothetical protein
MKEGRTADVAKTLDESDFNLSKIDTADDVKNVVDAVRRPSRSSIDAAKHGVQSFADIKKMADLLGAGTKSLKELYQGHRQPRGPTLRAPHAAHGERRAHQYARAEGDDGRQRSHPRAA